MSGNQMDWLSIEVSEEAVDFSKLQRFVDSPQHGAQVSFSGLVRDWNLGKKVLHVAYDAYVPLAEKSLTEIAHEAREKWGPELRVAIHHRLGKLAVGEASVVIAVSTTHRDEAFSAARHVIEELKVRVPIWKKEYYSDGETEWLKGHALCGHHGHSAENSSRGPDQAASPPARLRTLE